MNDLKKHHEVVVRHRVVTAEGREGELLERITYERNVLGDGSLSEPVECNRRFDMRTGEPVFHLGGDDFELRDLEGHRLRMTRTAS